MLYEGIPCCMEHSICSIDITIKFLSKKIEKNIKKSQIYSMRVQMVNFCNMKVNVVAQNVVIVVGVTFF